MLWLPYRSTARPWTSLCLLCTVSAWSHECSRGGSAIATADGFRNMSPFIILWETRQRINLEVGAFKDSSGFDVGQGPHINQHCLQMKWIHSGRRQLRQRWVSKFPGGN